MLTHSHLDHFAGMPYYVSQRSLQRLKPPNIYVPEAIYDKVSKLLEIYAELENFPYKLNLVKARHGERFPINKQFSFSAHPTFHRVPSQGYTVYESKYKLRPEYQNLDGAAIKQLRENQTQVTELIELPIFSFSGDTKIEYVLENDDVSRSKVLFLECTYIDDKKKTADAREWGHIHLDEIAHYADSFKNEKLVLIHFSPRYSYKQIRETVKNKLPSSLYDRVELFLPSKKK
ncbi:MBL fold metallo-hydrolase [Leptospira sp. GIMC2001]|uniref:MBL fold metallo-hydrolase n=1 Tax=Leptospira sp. GIMC2001 TaxID=1513297 RepID=UPI00234944DC|nr:MBL fold metallo-hydrolase [Leptospira sp. GIMC2001]WCL51328.1 MBL fold metallo-hydrolase [Leptospira sp. GIMC2001]